MKIAILGAGNSGCALAADYSYRGHEVTLIKTSNAMHDDNFNYLSENNGTMVLDEFGTLKVGHIAHISRNLQDVKGNDVVMICVQTIYHKELIRKLVQYLEPCQILMINPGYLSTSYVLEYCPDPEFIIAETESTFIDGRIMSPGHFRVGFRNVRNPIGIYPASCCDYAKKVLDNLGTPFTYLSTVIEAALHNPNMIVHTVGAIMSIPRIEATKGEYCMYHEVFTPSVWKILEALDNEKMRVLTTLGCEPLSYVEACKFRNSLDETRDAKEVFFDYAAMPTRAKGPVKVESRYITEDVSQGLVLLESMAKSLDIPSPVASSLIEIASAALGYDLRERGRSIEALGLINIQKILSDAEGLE